MSYSSAKAIEIYCFPQTPNKALNSRQMRGWRLSAIKSYTYIEDSGRTKVRLYYTDGTTEVIDASPSPYCYVPSKFEIQTSVRVEPTQLKTIDTEESVKKYTFALPAGVAAFRKNIEMKGYYAYEADIKYNVVWALANNFRCCSYNNRMYWDIEVDDSAGLPNVEKANCPIIAIGFKHGDEERTITGKPEREILAEFVEELHNRKIEALLGWNSNNFDFPYFRRRLYYNGVSFDRMTVRFLDLMLLYKYTQKNATRYSLKYIAEKVWGETKPYTTQPISSLSKEQLEERNLWDVRTTQKIDSQFFLSQLAIIIAQKSHLFPDTIIGIKPNDKQGLRVTLTPTLDALFLESAHKCGYVLPCKQHYTRPPYKGAIMTTYKPGIYSSVIQLDFSSLYPNIMLGFGLAPYGKTEVFHPIIREFLSTKDVAKSEGEYWAMKVLANSVYGIFASEYARIRAYEVAAKITEKERAILTAIFSLLSSMGYDVLLSDTDSFFIPVKDKMEYKTIQETINQFVAVYFGTPNIKVKFKGFWEIFGLPRSAIGEQVKKRYFGRLTFDENLKPCNEIIIVGLEAIRNDWCRLAQDIQRQIIEMKINNTPNEEIQSYINTVKQNLYNGKYFNELILTNSLSKNIDAYGGVKRDEKTQKMRKIQTPRHVRALKEALENNWVPHDTILYNYVEYFIVKNNKPKLAHITKPEEIDYNYYWYRQICPLLFRLGVINEIPRYKGQKSVPSVSQLTLG